MNKFKILLLFLGISLVGYSQSPITVKQGDSFTALLVFDNAYDVNRLQDISVSINRQEVAKKSTGGIVATNNVRAFRMPLSSATMRRYQGSNTLEIAVDDSILGVRRISPLTLIVSASQNGFNNGSVNTGVDATINMTISATSITTNTVLAQVMKGDKGDPGDGSGGGGTSIDTTLYVRKVSGWALSQNSYTTAEKSKLAGIASGATANSTDAQLRDRSTHTGVQAQSTVTNLVSDLAAKLNIADTTGLLRKTTAAGLYQPKGSYLTSINSSQVTTALGFTPYDASNPSGYITSSALSPYLTTSTAASTYQQILTSGTTIKTVNGASLLGSGNIVISGSGTAIDTTLFLQKTTAAGLYQPKGSYLTSINSSQVTTALGFTPYNSTNPSGYITSSALSPYLTSATAASTYQPIGSYLVSADLAAYLPKSDTTLYVRKVSGWALSQNNFTAAEKSKLAGIASGAEVNVNADWNAVSGDAQILNKPTLGTASALDVAATGNAATGEVVKGNDTRLSDARTPTAHNHTTSNITDFDAAVAANTAVVANSAKVSNATHTGDVIGSTTLTYNNVVPANKGGAGSVNGILTANGSGTVSAATTTGSGNVVLATSPVLTTPALGTPQSGDFSTGTFTWPTFNQNTTGVASNVSGTVAIANGGTGATTVGQARTNLGLGTLATQSGTFSGSSSGTNTGDQTITLIGDVTGSGTGTFSATIAAGAVTLSGMANVASGTILGRATAATGVVEALSGSQVKTLIGLGSAENTAISTWAGSSNITTLGTIGTGVWDGTAIADGKIATALTGKTYNGLTISSTTGTLGITDAKVFNVANSLTLSGTDGSTLNIGSGGTLGTGAYATIASYATLANPAFTGVPTAPTATSGTNTTQIATTAYVEDAKNKTLESIEVAFSDGTTGITTGNGKETFYMPYAFTVTEVFLAVKTAQSSGAVFTVDINEEGVSILSTKLTLDNTETKSSTAATPAVISDTSLAKWATMTIDVDQSSGIAVGGKIIINGYRQ